MYGYIYKTTHLASGKIYIGQHKSEEFDPNYLGSGLHLMRAVKKYGRSAFAVEMLVGAESQEELDRREIDLIESYDARNLEVGYNIAVGGIGGQKGHHRLHTEETKQKIRDHWKTRSHTMSEESRMKISESYRTMPEDRKRARSEKLRQSRLGKTLSEETKAKIGAASKGRILSPQAHANMSAAQRGKPKPPKEQERMRTLVKGRIWIRNDSQNKMILPDELESYLAKGWVRGRHSFKTKLSKE